MFDNSDDCDESDVTTLKAELKFPVRLVATLLRAILCVGEE
jgi:hypothetical protein